jgi:hypothetical protein
MLNPPSIHIFPFFRDGRRRRKVMIFNGQKENRGLD